MKTKLHASIKWSVEFAHFMRRRFSSLSSSSSSRLSCPAEKRFGAFGPQTFKSRSLQSFQQDLEKGKAAHLMPMFNAKEQLAKGKIKKEDIPYMQRGGSWDNTDVKGAKKKNWNEADKNYDQNQLPMRVDWMGVSRVQGPAKTQNKKQEAPPKKKGWFGFSP